LGPQQANAGGAGGGAKEWTQLDNKLYLAEEVSKSSAILSEEVVQTLKQIEQLAEQIKMVEDMIKNTIGLPAKLLGKVLSPIKKIMGLYNKVNGLLGKLSNLDEELFNQFYSSARALEGDLKSGWHTNFSEEYYKVSVSMEKKAQEVAESLGVTGLDIKDSSEILEELGENATSSESRNALLQGANELLTFMSGEMIKVRALQAEQTATYLTYMERARTLEEAERTYVMETILKDSVLQEDTHVPTKYTW
jgi:P-type conjugative transfer protein TrbJ